MSAVTEARQAFASAIEGTGYLVFPQPMETIPVPSITLVPHQPYLELLTVGRNRIQIQVKATLMVAYNDNQASLMNLEDLIDKFLDAVPNGVQIEAFSQPSLVEVGPSKVLATEAVVTIITSKE